MCFGTQNFNSLTEMDENIRINMKSKQNSVTACFAYPKYCLDCYSTLQIVATYLRSDRMYKRSYPYQ
jgi:hypothetical protein